MRICGWCGRRRAWWALTTFCRRCAGYFNEAGIYLQSGGPPVPYMAELPKPGE